MNLDSDTRAPVLRFKDDQGKEYPEWKFKRFSSIAKKITDSIRFGDGKAVACIELENLQSNTGTLVGNISGSEKKSTKTKFAEGDVLFGKLRPYLRKYHLAKFSGACTSEIWVLRPNSIASEYLYFVVQGHQFFRAVNQQFGSKMPRSDWNIVSALIVHLPSDTQEQQKIANFLSSVDTRIEQLEKKKTLLELYKKGLMQKLFSQRIRFKDDEGEEFPEWEARSLEDFVKFSKGRGISRADVTEDGSFKCIRYGELYTLYKETISVVYSRTNAPVSELVLSQKHDVVMPSSGETALDMVSAACVLVGGVALGGDVNILRSQQNGIFLAYYLNSKRREIARYAQGISIIHLYAAHLKRVDIALPCIQEQQKIANCLSSVDRKIELITEQINQIRGFKKGLLQQMFI